MMASEAGAFMFGHHALPGWALPPLLYYFGVWGGGTLLLVRPGSLVAGCIKPRRAIPA